MNVDPGERAGLAAAILRAGHRCVECGEPLGAPVWDSGDWIPESFHRSWCPVLSAGPAMLLEWLDIWDDLHRVGYAADYGFPVARFAAASHE
jgi:hypothetical protein